LVILEMESLKLFAWAVLDCDPPDLILTSSKITGMSHRLWSLFSFCDTHTTLDSLSTRQVSKQLSFTLLAR
jgi:hypothetical protein